MQNTSERHPNFTTVNNGAGEGTTRQASNAAMMTKRLSG